MKPDFDRAECLARELRLLQPNDNFSLKISEMTFDRPILIDTFENYAKITNITVDELTRHGIIKDGYKIDKGIYSIILYHEDFVFEERANWTLAHEVGHIYLNHSKDGDIEEIEAHWFAAELLMPEILINEICRRKHSGINVFSIQGLFDTSFEASLKRIDSLNRKCMFSTYLKDDTIEKYNSRINQLCQKNVV